MKNDLTAAPAELSFPGLLSRSIEGCYVSVVDNSINNVEVTLAGPEGCVTLSGPTRTVHAMVTELDRQLFDLIGRSARWAGLRRESS